ncbi:MAG: helix-turn-helix transcriptional regulator [Gammaproteobacteria bacterium]
MSGSEQANKLLQALLNNYKLPTSNEIYNFCLPLFEAFDINYFDYTRYYPDNTCHVFISDFPYAEFFTSYREYRNKKGYDVPIKSLAPGKHLWQSHMCQHFLSEASQHFNHVIGLTIIKKHEQFTELYNFSASSLNTHVLDLYLNHDYILETFCACFKEHFSNSLKMKNNRIILPTGSVTEKKFTPNPALFDAFNKMLHSLVKIRKNNILIYVRDKLVSLTQQEINCLLLLSRGKTTKEIAKEIKISYKTADIHCNNLLKKTDSTSRLEMMSKFDKNFIADLLASTNDMFITGNKEN